MPASKLYFAQHGIAVDKAEDPERPLSTKGKSQTLSVAQQLASSGTNISQIFHSGKRRAEQTAEIFASTLNVASVSTIDFLSPNDDITLLLPYLTIDNALYIGHLPHLEKLVSCLVTGKTEPAILTFQNSAMVSLKNNNNNYSVLWYLTPGLLAS